MGLNEERTEPEYLLGRLVAYYETMERAAVNSTREWAYTGRYWPLALQGNPKPAIVHGEHDSVTWLQRIAAKRLRLAEELDEGRSVVLARMDQIPDRIEGDNAKFTMILGYRHQQAEFGLHDGENRTGSDGQL